MEVEGSEECSMNDIQVEFLIKSRMVYLNFTYKFVVGNYLHFNAKQCSHGLKLWLPKCLMALGESHQILHGDKSNIERFFLSLRLFEYQNID
jgi:hypothetical protein